MWTAFGRGWVTRQQSPFPIGVYTDPVPNISVVRGEPRDFHEHPTTSDLIVEVSDSHNFPMNTTIKAELYATAGVPDYWVLGLNGHALHAFRNPQHMATLGTTAYYLGKQDCH
ncbi:Uma2 family endonuclease [Frigoriglobus tundricola]|nr:Uma2 family endonuclease [Frigoriglobus tundricola]